ncbi:hypothetical protein BKP45_07055 [Anaerobacillus alkalidiazotrophicus]|uniref:Uncharacterized protein n=1 Tax=Anaerobacillus alkalidiazotrophicus TaxID=472963 RepID=A0A1S2MEV1_9BACI|nr:hypothetical protein [Anaerobacillus alkalidiazotrophicus]OIJ22387.1 hypothetical protein BKP45_07055 [Anaerobacillus alkalidiazotrophicus]
MLSNLGIDFQGQIHHLKRSNRNVHTIQLHSVDNGQLRNGILSTLSQNNRLIKQGNSQSFHSHTCTHIKIADNVGYIVQYSKTPLLKNFLWGQMSS